VRPESPIAQVFWLQVGLLDLPSGLNVGRLIHLHDVTAQIILRRGIWGFQTAINHKLRTPLAILTNSLDLLAHYRSDLSSDELANVSEMALEGVTRLRSHIGDILQYLDAPTLAQRGYSFELARLPQLVAEIGSHLGLEAVSVSVHENLADEAIVLSERAIELALWEILENTKKFHPGQAPHVSVVASCLESHKASLQISDDGLTLSPEQLVQAWTPYYQGEKHFTGQVHGMGLGLSTVAVLVWGVGGTCRMYNRPQGPGVVVELVLPLAKDELP
jgi:K+-sensing histidine kinase KdpD